MNREEASKKRLEKLKEKLQEMLESNEGIVTEEIVEVSQLLDKFILEEMKNNNYDKK